MSYVYKLRGEVNGHDRDVRAVSCLSDDFFVSGSRDFTARIWTLSEYVFCELKNFFYIITGVFFALY